MTRPEARRSRPTATVALTVLALIAFAVWFWSAAGQFQDRCAEQGGTVAVAGKGAPVCVGKTTP